VRAPRMTTRRWMIVVVVAALNLAAAHLLLAYHPFILLGVTFNGLVLQVASYRLTRNRGLKQAFCVGFIAVGLLSGGHFIWMMMSIFEGHHQPACSTMSEGIRPAFQVPIPPYLSNQFSEMCAIFLGWPYERLFHLPYCNDLLQRQDAVRWIVFTLLAFLPQVVVALEGGLLALLMVWVTRHLRRERIG
jgi:hypothetical protein